MKTFLAGLLLFTACSMRAVPPEIEKALGNSNHESAPASLCLLPRTGFTPVQLGLGPLTLAHPSDTAFLNLNLYSQAQSVAGLSLTLYSRACHVYGLDLSFSSLESGGAGIRIAGLNACAKFSGFTCALLSRITENYGVSAALFNRSGRRRGKHPVQSPFQRDGERGWNFCQIGITNRAENGLQIGVFNTNLGSCLPFFPGVNFSPARPPYAAQPAIPSLPKNDTPMK